MGPMLFACGTNLAKHWTNVVESRQRWPGIDPSSADAECNSDDVVQTRPGSDPNWHEMDRPGDEFIKKWHDVGQLWAIPGGGMIFTTERSLQGCVEECRDDHPIAAFGRQISLEVGLCKCCRQIRTQPPSGGRRGAERHRWVNTSERELPRSTTATSLSRRILGRRRLCCARMPASCRRILCHHACFDGRAMVRKRMQAMSDAHCRHPMGDLREGAPQRCNTPAFRVCATSRFGTVLDAPRIIERNEPRARTNSHVCTHAHMHTFMAVWIQLCTCNPTC